MSFKAPISSKVSVSLRNVIETCCAFAAVNDLVSVFEGFILVWDPTTFSNIQAVNESDQITMMSAFP